ncbi:hypothetical protein C0081_20440 [Cohaesibacter celericrescens]|uniref:Uncharacterized protein n=1 Tax=Cohaesibacter celericrescens TaxID=2067669 RepID=A0A2N5XL22_9HYPH|nr:hypothetical protein C0081_20440 [Cohaesibacter celericrescens]
MREETRHNHTSAIDSKIASATVRGEQTLSKIVVHVSQFWMPLLLARKKDVFIGYSPAIRY